MVCDYVFGVSGCKGVGVFCGRGLVEVKDLKYLVNFELLNGEMFFGGRIREGRLVWWR